ncbi:hypothetical protein G7051_00550 [Dysgonomonas sp. HDW5B]|uniref:type VI secretion system tube protein TssD n=1 Tax=Dysgonomonas sp. HDW5B TaxID=2714927 RepID=UPI0014093FBB|nr:type VI secretion system tube protein TssD [Dysgonomonas sp. HDW5B]QIK52915.1 hypothetical protein G7051_00550 [Dysgonomonas sp. HDW5B]
MFTHKTHLRIGSLESINASKLFDDSKELAKCSYTFAKGIDGKGQVQSKAEIIKLELSSLPSKAIIQWALNPRKYESGMIVFSDDAGTPSRKDSLYRFRMYVNGNQLYANGKCLH